MATHQVYHPAVGAAVYTADGEQFAYVKEIHGDFIKLDVPWSPDYWLSCAHIAEMPEDRVVLRFNKDEVDDHKLEAPPVDQPVTQATGDAVIGQDEMLEQRERMERELAAQRERMRMPQ